MAIGRTRSISKQRSSRFGAGCGGVILVLFLLVFVAVGFGVMYFVSGVPLLNVQRARSWQPAQCEITFSHLAVSRDSDGDNTSRIDIQYRYVWNDRAYTGRRYDFTVGSDNMNSAWKQSVIDAHAPGSIVTCYVDANDPTQSVINRELRWGYLFGLAFGAPFALIPLAIVSFMLYFNRREQRRVEKAITTPISTSASPASSFASSFAPGTPAAVQTSTGPVVLKPETSRIARLIVMIVICVIWNGLVGVVTYFELTGQLKSGGEWFVTLFLIPFQLIGALILWGVFYTFLGLMNPKPTLTLSSASVPIGGSMTLQWKMSRNAGRLKNLRIVLSGHEEARYRRGTDTHTDKSTFYEAQVIETTDRMRIEQGMTTVTIPQNTMHSFVADDNKIVWSLKVTGEISLWPDVDDTFDIIVRPR
jgi:hypothetical protein